MSLPRPAQGPNLRDELIRLREDFRQHKDADLFLFVARARYDREVCRQYEELPRMREIGPEGPLPEEARPFLTEQEFKSEDGPLVLPREFEIDHRPLAWDRKLFIYKDDMRHWKVALYGKHAHLVDPFLGFARRSWESARALRGQIPLSDGLLTPDLMSLHWMTDLARPEMKHPAAQTATVYPVRWWPKTDPITDKLLEVWRGLILTDVFRLSERAITALLDETSDREDGQAVGYAKIRDVEVVEWVDVALLLMETLYAGGDATELMAHFFDLTVQIDLIAGTIGLSSDLGHWQVAEAFQAAVIELNSSSTVAPRFST